jgi:methyl-accepting chemotaxis protein
MDKSLYGIVFLAGGIPIFAHEQLIGAIAIGVSLEKENLLAEISEELSAFTQQVSASTANISDKAHKLALKNDSVHSFMLHMQEQINKTSAIIGMIREISEQANLLGLNASIEAAHAKELGRGFNVVAQEIRKLANHAHQSSKHIMAILQELRQEMNNLSQLVRESVAISQEQFNAIHELSNTMEKVSKEAQKLADLANIHK